MKATAADCLSDSISTAAVLLATLASILFPQFQLNLDAYMGVVVAIIILIAGVKILNETKNSILGEAPSEEIVKTIQNVVAEYPRALGMHDLIIHNYGPGHIIAAFHIEVDGSEDVFEIHDMVDLIEQRLRNEHHMEATIHMDPIVTDDARITTLRTQVAKAVQEIDGRIHIHDFRFVPGETHTNLIFDVAVPFELKMSDEEIRRAVSDQISRIDPSYFAVITVDKI